MLYFFDKSSTLSYYQNAGVKTQRYEFSPEKNEQLIQERGVGFEEVIAVIKEGGVLDILPHPNCVKYPKQKIYVLQMNGYVYLVPFVRKDEDTVFLKTIFPHRKSTKRYLNGDKDE